MSASNQHVPGTMLTFWPPWTTPMLTVTRCTMSLPRAPAPRQWPRRPRPRRRRRRRARRRELGQVLEVDDHPCRDLGGAGVRCVYAPCAARSHGEPEPERPFLAEADRQRAARLAVQQAVAVDLRVMLDQVAGAPRPEGLVVGDGGEGQPPGQSIAEPVQIAIGEDRGRRPRLHGHPPPVDPALCDRAAPRAMGPPSLASSAGNTSMWPFSTGGGLAALPRTSQRCWHGHCGAITRNGSWFR